jgi:ATP-dependent Clp protease ATP-binding subunit ClpC
VRAHILGPVFERFTDRARRVVVLAQEEARMLNHNYIGTEHLLLGLIQEGEGVAAQALDALGISLEDARRDIEEIIGQGPAVPTGHIPFTPRAKKVLEFALREALQLGHNYIGTEHILLGLVREGEGVAAQVLQKLGADLARVREIVVELLPGSSESAGRSPRRRRSRRTTEVAPSGTPVSPEDFPTCSSCSAPLAETMAVKVFELAVDDQPAQAKVAYCGRCGTALGTIL